jgi:hypothetical protein
MPFLSVLGGGREPGNGRGALANLQRGQITERGRKPKRGRSRRSSRTGPSNRTDRTLSRAGGWPPTVLNAFPQHLDRGAKLVDFLRGDQSDTSNSAAGTAG